MADIQEVMAEAARRGTLLDALGITVVELGADRAVATMAVDDRTRQPFGLLHGGASLALAETVASAATCELIDLDKYYAVGMQVSASHIRAKRSGLVTAVGIPLHRGRTTMVWDVKITDEQQRLICTATCTMGIFPKDRL